MAGSAARCRASAASCAFSVLRCCQLVFTRVRYPFRTSQKEAKQLEVLAFPCDQFMHQEKGDTAAVCSFAARKGAKWPIFDKARAACYSFSARRCMHAVLTAHARMPRRCHAVQVEVNGPGMSPVYAFLKASSGDTSDVEWNFGKFLLDGSGKVVKRYPPDVPPKALVKDIEAL